MPKFKPNPNGMKPSGFKMKNSALHASAKYGSPMQANYNPSPVKATPAIIATIVNGVRNAVKAVRAAGGVKEVVKAGRKAIVKKATKVKDKIVEDYKNEGITKTLADSAVEGTVNRVVAPREEEDTSIIQGEQKSIM